MKLDGTQSPAEAIREEINKLKKESGMEVESNTEETNLESIDELDQSSELEAEENEFETATYETPEKTVPREQTLEYWKSRFDVMQGKYNAEVPRLQDSVGNLREQVELLTARVQQPNTIDTTNQSVGAILDDLEEQYGSEFTNAIDARISRTVKQSVQEQVGKFEADLNTIKQSQAVSEQQMFDDAITSVSANWRSLNVDPDFVSWVQNSVENFSGSTFQKILIDAYTHRDVSKVAKIFNTYENLKKQTRQTAKQKADDASALIAPPKRGSSSNATIENNSGKVFTMAQVNDFYAKLTQGAYRGKDAWVRSMKEAIASANVEGRIV